MLSVNVVALYISINLLLGLRIVSKVKTRESGIRKWRGLLVVEPERTRISFLHRLLEIDFARKSKIARLNNL